MYFIVKEINFGNLWLNLFTKIVTGISVYFGLVMVFDRDVRRNIIQILKKYFKLVNKKETFGETVIEIK